METKMKACILVKTKPGEYDSVARAISEFEGVKASFPVMGRTDVVVRAETADLKTLSALALKVGAVEGVYATETLIALEEG